MNPTEFDTTGRCDGRAEGLEAKCGSRETTRIEGADILAVVRASSSPPRLVF